MTPDQLKLTSALAALGTQARKLCSILLAEGETPALAANRIEADNANLKVQVVIEANDLVATLRLLAYIESLEADGLEVHPTAILVNPARRGPTFYGPMRRAAG